MGNPEKSEGAIKMDNREKTERAIRMDNPEKLATYDTYRENRRSHQNGQSRETSNIRYI